MKTLATGIVATMLLFTGCAKKGCTDKDATNYDSKAKKDDATCKYEGNVVFWQAKKNADTLVANGATALTYYVDGSIAGSSAASIYFTGAPNCGQNGPVTVKKDLGSDKTKSYSFSVKDQTNFEWYKGTLQFSGNTCTAYQLQ